MTVSSSYDQSLRVDFLKEVEDMNRMEARQMVGDIDLCGYKSVHGDSYYGDKRVNEMGSVQPISAVTDDVAGFLEGIGEDVGLWNGERGVLGREHDGGGEWRRRVKVEEIEPLRVTYIDVKRSLNVEKTQRDLRRELGFKMRIWNELEEGSRDMEKRAERVRKGLAMEAGGAGKNVKMLHRMEEDVEKTKTAGELIGKRVMELRVDIADGERGFLQRFAVLGRIFGGGNTKLVAETYYKGTESEVLVDNAEKAVRESVAAMEKKMRAMRFYVDMKVGLGHLYRVESTLKAVLENLTEAMKTENGEASEVGVDYRLGYVRQLWGRVEVYMKQAWEYVKETSLRNGFAVSEGGRDMAVNGVELLRLFAKIEMETWTSRKKRIEALHKEARAAYKIVNAVFDEQERWVARAGKELKKREDEEMEMNQRLITLWESLLGIPNGNN